MKNETSRNNRGGFFTYENGLLALMCVTFGLVFVDRFALVYLSPFIVKDLGLNNTQVGMLVSALGITWAVLGYFATAWAVLALIISFECMTNSGQQTYKVFPFRRNAFGRGDSFGKKPL